LAELSQEHIRASAVTGYGVPLARARLMPTSQSNPVDLCPQLQPEFRKLRVPSARHWAISGKIPSAKDVSQFMHGELPQKLT
jgi:hypothetical protein